MKKALIPFLSVLIFLASCKDSEEPVSACGVTDPVENLAWLNDSITNIESGDFKDETYLVMATYEGQTVFFFGYCCPSCLSIAITFYDCNGDVIEEQGIINNLENQQVIWKSRNSTCNLD